MRTSTLRLLAVAVLAVFGAGCQCRSAPPPSFDGGVGPWALSGTVTGLVGSGLLVANNESDRLSLLGDGVFTFEKRLSRGAPYDVTVLTQPTSPKQSCTVANGSGTMGQQDVNDVTITCVVLEGTVGGTVTGLRGAGLMLENSGADDLAVSADGAFTFATPVPSGSAYAVTVKTQPKLPTQTCAVQNGSGTVQSADVKDVAVTCTTDTFSVGGTVSGLQGTLVLTDLGADDLTLTADGAFTFPTKVASGATYSVAVKTRPSAPSQTCTVVRGAGVVGGGDVTDVAVTCATDTFTVGGSVSGLLGTLVLQNAGGDDLTLTTSGPFTFATPVRSGQPYAVTIKTQPSSPQQVCTIASGTGSGTVTTANVSAVAITCVTETFTIGGTVSGLSGTVVLRNNGKDDLSLTADGPFTFATPVASGQVYAVTVKAQPSAPAQVCTVTGSSGTVTNASITSVVVACVTQSFTVGGTVIGLQAPVVLENNGADGLAVNLSGGFTFPTKVLSGTAYAVTVKTQPSAPSQECVVTSGTGTGTMGGANVTSVVIRCPDASGQITTVRNASAATLDAGLPIDGALVTFKVPAVGTDPGGFVVQSAPTGPALLIGDTAAPVSVGDRVSLLATGTTTVSSLKVVTSYGGLVVHGSGVPVSPLVQNVNGAADLVSSVGSYESELVRVGGTGSATQIVGSFGGPGTSGAGHQAAPIQTDALDAGITLRVPDGLVSALGLAPGCTFRLNDTPFWRAGSVAEPSAWSTADLTVTSCPAPTVTPSPSNGATLVSSDAPIVLTFNQPMATSTVTAQAAVGPCAGSVQLSTDGFVTCLAFAAPSFSPNADVITLTPAPALSYGIAYQLKVAGTVKAVAGAVALGADQLFSFTTDLQPANCNGLSNGAVVISQVYGGGGNLGAPWDADFIELHNRGNQPVDLTGWTVQYSAPGSTLWNTIAALSGAKAQVPAGGFLLLQAGVATVGTGAPLPTPDFAGGPQLNATSGKVALVKASALLSGACPVSATIADLIGYGPSAACAEGPVYAPSPSNTQADLRRLGGCIDSNVNATDFTLVTPDPRSSATAAALCPCAQFDVCVNETNVPAEADYCSLQFVTGNTPGSFALTLAAGATSPMVYGQLYEAGLTPGSTAGVLSQVGVGPASVNPESQSGWQWFPTTQNTACSGCGNNVEFGGSFTLPVSATSGSTWAFTTRYSLNNGISWTYCDANGAGANASLTFEATKLGTVSVP